MKKRRELMAACIESQTFCRESMRRNFGPGDRTACSTSLTISDGDAYLVETRREIESLSPLDEAVVFGEYFSRDVELLFEGGELTAIVDRDTEHVDYGAGLVEAENLSVDLHREV